ncbi:MAG: hypothetical protein DMF91_14840 [Acidobacteria bacterium]|nr:MAG: hypothetical protein DMF91_14840 [Acidobacteriota bacterium]
MSRRVLITICTAVWLGVAHQASTGLGASSDSRTADAASPVRIPAVFVANAGQFDRGVRFYSRGARHAVFATDDGVTLALGSQTRGLALRLTFVSGSPGTRVEAGQPDQARVNYFLGRDPSTWRSNVATFREVLYRNAWSGIDMSAAVQPDRLKYEFRVSPGADPLSIRLRYEGATRLSISERGDLRIESGEAMLTDNAPRAFQYFGERAVPVSSSFVLFGNGEYGIAVGDYDRTRPLVIDPTIVYASYLGSSGFDEAYAVAVDAGGNAYVTGVSDGIDFPVTPGSFQSMGGGARPDAFVAKINSSGSALVYATYLGGADYETANGIAVDSGGNAYVTGVSYSADFPITAGAFQATLRGGVDAFVVKLNPTGSALLYSTRYGGSSYDTGQAIAVDASGRAYVAGATYSMDLPETTTGFQSAPRTDSSGNLSMDSFLIRLNADGSTVEYGTYMGGAAFDAASAVALHGTDAFVAGQTYSYDFPTTPGAYQPVAAVTSVLKSDDGAAGWRYGALQVDSVLALATDPSDAAIVYAGTQGQGIYKSTTGGDTFSPSAGVRAGAFVYAIAVDPTASHIVYAATSDGLHKSVDAGAHWALTGPFGSVGVGDVAVDAGSGAVFAADYRALWRSPDGGGSWVAVLGGTATAVLSDPSHAGTVFAGIALNGGTRMYRSADGGATWITIGDIRDRVRKLAFDPSSSIVYAATDSGGLFRSTGDAGFVKLVAFADRLLGVALDTSTTPTTIYAIQNQDIPADAVLKSTDGGSTVTRIAPRQSHVVPRSLAVTGPVTLLVGVMRLPDAFVTRVNTSATGAASLAYSTYLSGAGSDDAKGIAVDASGRAYVTGSTTSGDFPAAEGAAPLGGWLLRLNEAGSAIEYWARHGIDSRGVGIDASDAAYIVGAVSDDHDTILVAKYAGNGIPLSSLRFGGPATTVVRGLVASSADASAIAVGPGGTATIVGTAHTTSFPTTSGAFQPQYDGGLSDAFVAKIAFDTSYGPAAPNSPNPPSGATWVTVTPTLSWTSARATSYEIRFGTTNPPPTIVPDTVDYWYPTSRLNSGTTYFWQIVAKNRDGTTAGPVWSFSTDPTGGGPDGPAPPSSPNPPSGATWVTVTPTLSWRSDRATSYEVRFGTTNPPPTVASNTTEYWYATPRLNSGTMYFWQIVASNSSGTTAGPIWSFTTDPTAQPPGPPGPGTPSSPNPPSGTTWVTVTPTLSWRSDGATSYEIQFGWTNPPPTIVSSTVDWWYSTPTLSYATTYYWRIVATNSVGSTSGPIWQFTTAPQPTGPPEPPSNPSPADAATSVGSNPTLTWTSANATLYKVYFGKTQSPAFARYVSSPSNSVSAVGGGLWRFTTEPAFPGEGNIVIYASDIAPAALHGSWSVANDQSSPGGVKLITPDYGWSTTDAPLAAPTDYIDVTFNAPANTYHVWVRLKATGDTNSNDSVWVQLSDGQATGCCNGPAYRIGTTAGLLVNLEPCNGCGVSAWGWQDAAWWTGQSPLITFDRDGAHTMRIQVGKDGVQLDQIVLSPAQFMAAPPGPVKNDTTIVPK